MVHVFRLVYNSFIDVLIGQPEEFSYSQFRYFLWYNWGLSFFILTCET
jgi:hypothetical protein